MTGSTLTDTALFPSLPYITAVSRNYKTVLHDCAAPSLFRNNVRTFIFIKFTQMRKYVEF